MEYVIGGIAVLAGLIIGYVLSKMRLDKEISTLEERLRSSEQAMKDKEEVIHTNKMEIEAIRKEKEVMQNELVRRQADLEHSEEKLQEHRVEVEKLQEKFTKDFEILANKILEEKTTKFTAKNKENMELILNPLYPA